MTPVLIGHVTVACDLARDPGANISRYGGM